MTKQAARIIWFQIVALCFGEAGGWMEKQRHGIHLSYSRFGKTIFLL